MFGYKRSRSSVQAPAAVVYTADPDQAYRTAWGLTLGEWLQLGNDARRDLRDRVAYAPNLAAV